MSWQVYQGPGAALSTGGRGTAVNHAHHETIIPDDKLHLPCHF